MPHDLMRRRKGVGGRPYCPAGLAAACRHWQIQRRPIRPCPHHGFREGRLQKELLKVDGSWKSGGFRSLRLRLYLKYNIGVYFR